MLIKIRRLILVWVMALGFQVQLAADLIELDRVVAVVDGIVITTKDIGRRGYDGVTHSLDDLIDSVVLNSLGLRLKIEISDEDIERFLRDLDLTPAKLAELAQHWGYPSVAEFRAELKMVYRGANALRTELETKVMISEAEIRRYYEEHPVPTEAKLILQTCFVTNAKHKDRDQQRQELQKAPHLNWDLPIEIPLSNIPTENDFLLQLKAGERFVKPVFSGFDLFLLQRKVPAGVEALAKRRAQIIQILQEQKHTDALSKIKSDLRAKSHIFYPATN